MKIVNNVLIAVGALVVASGHLGNDASAEFITLVGVSELKIESDSNGAIVAGSYHIVNNGDEVAKAAFPELAMGNWRWSGEPKEIAAGAKKSWQINQPLAYNELGCYPLDGCAKGELPAWGYFFLRVMRHYEDLNGYKYSSVDLQRVYLGEVDELKASAMRVGAISAKMDLEQKDGSYYAQLEVYNTRDSSNEVYVSLHIPRELKASPLSAQLLIEPGATARTEFVLENFSSLPGSEYAFFIVLDWEEQQLRNSAQLGGRVVVGGRETSKSYLYGAFGAAIVMSVLLYLFVLRRSG